MQPFIGQIVLFAGNFVMKGWLPCDGRLLPIMEYQALFSLLGTTYGGDQQTTFGLPRLEPLGDARYLIAVDGIFPSPA